MALQFLLRFMVFSSLIKCQWVVLSQIQCVINVLMYLYLKEKVEQRILSVQLISLEGENQGWEENLTCFSPVC